MSDADNFVKALRDIDGRSDIPTHCRGHLHRMRLHACLDVVSMRDTITGRDREVFKLTTEGRARAYPQYGALRVSVDRVRRAINIEGGGDKAVGDVVYTHHRTERLATFWYTPDFAKTIKPKERL